MPQGLFIITER